MSTRTMVSPIRIYTLGADGQPGGQEEAADIYWADL